MGFITLPSILHTRTLYRPATSYGTANILTGVGGDAEYVVWYSSRIYKWVATRKSQRGSLFDCVITLNGRTLYPRGPINGYPAWTSIDYTLCWRSGRWYFVPSVYAAAILDPTDDVAWWRTAVTNVDEPDDMTLESRGAAPGGEIMSSIDNWEYWTCDTRTGVYQPKGAAGGTILVGTGKWQDDRGDEYVQKLEVTEDWWGLRYFGFTNMSTNNAHTWYIGTVGSSLGWWEGPTPSHDTSVTFNFTQNLDKYGDPIDPELTGEDRIVTFDGLTDEENETPVLITETPIWRG